jgi:hypothetical protein
MTSPFNEKISFSLILISYSRFLSLSLARITLSWRCFNCNPTTRSFSKYVCEGSGFGLGVDLPNSSRPVYGLACNSWKGELAGKHT